MMRPVLFIAVMALVSGCGGSYSNPSAPTTTASVVSVDIVEGTGVAVTAGRLATVTYALWLYDASRPEGKGTSIPQPTAPFSFLVGGGQVIRGWDQGVVGMKVGGQRRLTIPPELAYGNNSPGGGIPANATLVFDITLVSVS